MVKLDFAKGGGLLPAIAQDWKTGDVLMLAYINEEAWNETLKTGNATYWTRSRQKLWRKGEESGNVQKVKEIYVDCDEDTVIFKAEPPVTKVITPASSVNMKTANSSWSANAFSILQRFTRSDDGTPAHFFGKAAGSEVSYIRPMGGSYIHGCRSC